MKTIAFSGGSIPAGVGFDQESNSPLIYPNIFKEYGFEVKNLGLPSANNYEIFFSCLNFIATNEVNTVVLEWNDFYRYRFHPAPHVEIVISAQHCSTRLEKNVHYHSLSDRQLSNFQKTLIQLTHDYPSIMTLLDYCIILQSVCSSKKINLVMFNGSTPWTKDLIEVDFEKNLLEQLSTYSQNLLDFDYRSDDEIISLLSELRKKFLKIDSKIWANNPFIQITDFLIDRAPVDNAHPGENTHRKIASFIYENLKERDLL